MFNKKVVGLSLDFFFVWLILRGRQEWSNIFLFQYNLKKNILLTHFYLFLYLNWLCDITLFWKSPNIILKVCWDVSTYART